jgi:DNA modification methylase
MAAYREGQRLLALASHVRCRQIGPCLLVCCSWEEVYSLLPRKAAVVTDPPYDAGYDVTKKRRRPSRWRRNFVGADQPFDPRPWLEFSEVILFGANYYMEALPQGRHSWWLWDKMPGQDPGDYDHYERIWLSRPDQWRAYPFLWRGGMRKGEANISRLRDKHHPAEKPPELMIDLVQTTTAPVVIDPFMGSGTTLAACVRLGRPCIGIEIEPEDFDVACERLQQEVEARAQFELPVPLQRAPRAE